MRTQKLLIAIALLLPIVACNTSGHGDVDTAGGEPGEDTSFGFDTFPADTVGPGVDTTGSDDVPDGDDVPFVTDIVETEDVGTDAPPTEDTHQAEDTPPAEDIPEDTLPAGAYEPCVEDADCLSGLCGWHFGDKLCLEYCTEECPQDFACEGLLPDPESPDIVFVCASRFSHLCLPCWTDGDCQDDLTQNHACVKLGTIGGFCATVSEVPEADPVCPDDYIVSNTLKLVGEDPAGPSPGIVSGCVPPMGICPCTETAGLLALDTFCFSGSDDEGWCMGERLCTPDGLDACSVGPPSDEGCDGLDNDCDGETDEGLCDDGDPCTDDSCGGGTGCVFEPGTGAPCDDGDACTELDTCQAGVCVGELWESPDMAPCAQATCDPVTGVQVEFLEADCDDGDICTTNDHCVLGQCQGSFTPPEPPPADPCLEWTCDGVGGWFTVPIPEGSCDDDNTCTTDSCEAGVGCVHAPIDACCGNGISEAGEECDDGNQVAGDGCDADCVQETFAGAFVGYTTFNHNVCDQTFEETDAFMDAACLAAYGAGSKAASVPDLLAGIPNLPGNNNSGDWVMFKCPLCEGSLDYWTCGGEKETCRKGLPAGAAWPTTADSGWNPNMCNATRSAICLQ